MPRSNPASWRVEPSLVARRARHGGAALLCTALLGLTACGGEEVGAKPELPTETPALWNPCDALDSAFIKAQFGTVADKRAGTPAKPDCRFSPAEKTGQPAISANYQLFGGTLAEAWATMGQPKDADVRTPKVSGADDARVVVAVVKGQLYVTGFVENGDLIQQVDVIDPQPFDKDRVVRGTIATLGRLSAHAAKKLD